MAKENPAYFLKTPRFKSFQNRSLSLHHDVANWHSAANDSQQFSPPDDERVSPIIPTNVLLTHPFVIGSGPFKKGCKVAFCGCSKKSR